MTDQTRVLTRNDDVSGGTVQTASKRRFYVCINGHRETWHGPPADLIGPPPLSHTPGYQRVAIYECAVEDCHAEAELVRLYPEGGTCDYCGYDITADGRGHDASRPVADMQEANRG